MPDPTLAWKGLDTRRMPVFIGYDQIERLVVSMLDQVRPWQPDEVVAVARGGLVPATMVAGILALPMSFMTHDRNSGCVTWIGSPATGRRILLVDDSCSTGKTLQHTAAAIRARGQQCKTLVIVFDPETTVEPPDFGHSMKDLFRLPWERGEATPTGRAARAGAGPILLAEEAPFTAISLGQDMLEAIAGETQAATLLGSFGFPPVAPDRCVIITEAAVPDPILRNGWLGNVALEPLPVAAGESPDTTARHKADIAVRWGCTHYVESDLEQAVRVSSLAPHLIVSWWSATDRRSWTIGAAADRPAGADRSTLATPSG